MKTLFLTVFMSFSMFFCFAQEKTKQQLKEEKKIAKQKQVQSLIDSKEYEFVAVTAYPQGTRSIDMVSNPNYLRIKNDSVFSEMPYFGRAFAGVGYGGSGGLDFKGPVQDFSITKNKKDYTIKAKVKDNSDSYTIILTVFFEGNASLTINSVHRNSINYRGSIDKIIIK
ncbi:Protein of unknown function DUF4251 [Flavobacteriaceae bacterium]